MKGTVWIRNDTQLPEFALLDVHVDALVSQQAVDVGVVGRDDRAQALLLVLVFAPHFAAGDGHLGDLAGLDPGQELGEGKLFVRAGLRPSGPPPTAGRTTQIRVTQNMAVFTFEFI